MRYEWVRVPYLKLRLSEDGESWSRDQEEDRPREKVP